MQTYTTAAFDAADAYAASAAPTHARPLMLDECASSVRGGAADAVRGGPVRRDVSAGAIDPLQAALLARHATADRRGAGERALDRVTDRLMAELGW